ncbi:MULTISPECIES: sensor histidine kinase [unclassified Paenibacillus]|uniref:sensor histidine kinase n=1 Tax=unclassified Paenibacillus TaxID=185978 RepID=UPI002F40E2A3
MIIFILAIMLITGIVLVLTSMKSTSTWLAGSFIGSMLLIVGFMFYFAKSGGLPYRMEIIFFLHTDIHRYFQYSMITIDQMSRLLCIGRAVFLFFSAGFVINVSDIIGRNQKRYLYGAVFVFALMNYLIYEPTIYAALTAGASDTVHTWTAVIVRGLNIMYVLGTLYILFRQLKRMKTPWLKNNFMIVLITVVNLQIIFMLFGVFSPLQVSHAIAVNNSFLGTLYYGHTLSLVQWYVMIVVSFLMTIVGTMSLWKYNKLIGQIGKPEMMLEKKIRENNMGVRIFTHGIKNQLLAQRVLIRNMKKKSMEENEETAAQEIISGQLEQLAQSNEQILQRMDELYSAFKSNRMQLKPTPLRVIYDDVLKKLEESQRKLLKTNEFEDQFLLADRPYIVQTICNLLSNAFDAVADNEANGRKQIVSFDAYQAGDRIVLQIKDNGVGIEKGQRNRIFEPFYTRKNSNTNWGIGLSYVQQTVKAHFGFVRFESKLGEGTTFYVYLPIYRPNS